MINGWKLAVAAAISGGLTGSIGSEALEGGIVEPMAPPAELVQRAERVSVEFNNASVKEVLDWLKHKKVNFVAAEAEVDRSAKITLNVENAPLEDVVNSIATALGGRWVKDGEMRVFKRGQAFFPGSGGSFRYEMGDQARREVEEAMKNRVWTDKDGRFFPKDFEVQRLKELEGLKGLKGVPGTVWVHPNWEKMTPEQRTKFEKDMQERMKITERTLEKVQKEMDLRMKDMPDRVFMSPKWEKMTPEQRAKFEKDMHERMKISEKAMEKAHKEMELRMKDMNRVFMAPNWEKLSPNWEKMSPEERAKFEKEMHERMKISEKDIQEMRKNLGETRVWIAPGKGESFMPLDVERINSKALEGVRVLRTSNLKDLVSSLTPDQLEKHRRDGFLTPQDLTERQRKMLGMEGKGDWSIVYSSEGKKVTFKNKK